MTVASIRPSRRNHSFILRIAGGDVAKDEGMIAPQDEAKVSLRNLQDSLEHRIIVGDSSGTR